jgi:hypothetical protein
VQADRKRLKVHRHVNLAIGKLSEHVLVIALAVRLACKRTRADMESSIPTPTHRPLVKRTELLLKDVPEVLDGDEASVVVVEQPERRRELLELVAADACLGKAVTRGRVDHRHGSCEGALWVWPFPGGGQSHRWRCGGKRDGCASQLPRRG